MSNPSQILFPIINPISGTINEVDGNGNTIYEALRHRFIITGDENGDNFNERAICKTIKEFLLSNLSDDKVIGVNSNGDFEFVNNNIGSSFQRDARVYKQYEKFIYSCLDIMIINMNDVFNLTPSTNDNNIEIRKRLVIKMETLKELKKKYTEHGEAMNILNQLKYIM